MTDSPDLWGIRELPDGLTLEMHAGDAPALALVQGEDRVRVELAHVKGLVAALVDDAYGPGAAICAGDPRR